MVILETLLFEAKDERNTIEKEWDVCEVNGTSTDFRVNISVQYQEKQYYLKQKHVGENEA